MRSRFPFPHRLAARLAAGTLALPLAGTAIAALPGAARGARTPPATATAAPGPAPAPVDVSAVKDKLVVLSDGKSHLVALVPFSFDEDAVFYGDAHHLYSLPLHGGGGTQGKEFSVNFVEPRFRSPAEASIDFKDGKYSVLCGTRTTALTPLPADQGKKIVAAASFEKSPRRHRAYALARDSAGIYYFVDRGRTPETERNFRLFVGPKGNLKLQKMTNVVSDSEGDIFATRTGSLRLILNKNESTWQEKGKPKKLLLVPVEDNVTMIYNELGPYSGERLGTPCDDL